MPTYLWFLADYFHVFFHRILWSLVIHLGECFFCRMSLLTCSDSVWIVVDLLTKNQWSFMFLDIWQIVHLWCNIYINLSKIWHSRITVCSLSTLSALISVYYAHSTDDNCHTFVKWRRLLDCKCIICHIGSPWTCRYSGNTPERSFKYFILNNLT